MFSKCKWDWIIDRLYCIIYWFIYINDSWYSELKYNAWYSSSQDSRVSLSYRNAFSICSARLFQRYKNTILLNVGRLIFNICIRWLQALGVEKSGTTVSSKMFSSTPNSDNVEPALCKLCRLVPTRRGPVPGGSHDLLPFTLIFWCECTCSEACKLLYFPY